MKSKEIVVIGEVEYKLQLFCQIVKCVHKTIKKISYSINVIYNMLLY